MDQGLIIALGKKTLQVTLFISGPMLGFGLLAGLLVSVFQAVTQIQDMTLTFVPKILAVILALVIFAPWMLNMLVDFTIQLFTEIPRWSQ